MKFGFVTVGLIAIAAVLVEPSTASPTLQKVGSCIGSERVKLPSCDLQTLGEAKLGELTCSNYTEVIREHDWEAYTNCTEVLVPKVANCSSLEATSIVIPQVDMTLKRFVSQSIGTIGATMCMGPDALEECAVDCLVEIGLTISGETIDPGTVAATTEEPTTATKEPTKDNSGSAVSVTMHSLALLALAGAVAASV